MTAGSASASVGALHDATPASTNPRRTNVDLKPREILMLRSLLATRRAALLRRKPDPTRLGAMSTLAIEIAAVDELDDKLATANDDKIAQSSDDARSSSS